MSKAYLAEIQPYFKDTVVHCLNNAGIADLLLHVVQCWRSRGVPYHPLRSLALALYCAPAVLPFYKRLGFYVIKHFGNEDGPDIHLPEYSNLSQFAKMRMHYTKSVFGQVLLCKRVIQRKRLFISPFDISTIPDDCVRIHKPTMGLSNNQYNDMYLQFAKHHLQSKTLQPTETMKAEWLFRLDKYWLATGQKGKYTAKSQFWPSWLTELQSNFPLGRCIAYVYEQWKNAHPRGIRPQNDIFRCLVPFFKDMSIRFETPHPPLRDLETIKQVRLTCGRCKAAIDVYTGDELIYAVLLHYNQQTLFHLQKIHPHCSNMYWEWPSRTKRHREQEALREANDDAYKTLLCPMFNSSFFEDVRVKTHFDKVDIESANLEPSERPTHGCAIYSNSMHFLWLNVGDLEDMKETWSDLVKDMSKEWFKRLGRTSKHNAIAKEQEAELTKKEIALARQGRGGVREANEREEAARRRKARATRLKLCRDKNIALLEAVAGVDYVERQLNSEQPRKKQRTKEETKVREKMAEMARYHFDRRFQIYLVALMFCDPNLLSLSQMYAATKHFIADYKKSDAYKNNPSAPIPKHWLGFSFIRGEHEENDYNYNGENTDTSGRRDRQPLGPQKFKMCVLIIAEEWFSDMNSVDSATFPRRFLATATSAVNEQQDLSKDQKRRIRTIAVRNGWFKQIVDIYRTGEPGKYAFTGHQLKRLPQPEPLTEKWLIDNFKYKDRDFYNKLYNPELPGPFKVPAGAAKITARRRRTKGAPMLFLLQDKTAGCVFCSLASGLFSYGDIIAANIFKSKLPESLKADDRMQFAADVATNRGRKKGEQRVHLEIERFTEKDQYNPLTDVSPFPSLLRLRDKLDGLSHCVTTVGNYIFDSNVPFALPLDLDALNECCTDKDLPKGCNGYNGVYEAIRFRPTQKNKCKPNNLM